MWSDEGTACYSFPLMIFQPTTRFSSVLFLFKAFGFLSILHRAIYMLFLLMITFSKFHLVSQTQRTSLDWVPLALEI
jgi:hypothetical protein